VPNPNFGEPIIPGTTSGTALLTSYHTPREIRVGARFEF